ncbi:hypothetical protein [Desulfovibrio gilichinskyi]|uniref:Uncharacterized protein n=1 Tax=Desulfovibrio gilichinskyi TaxID=1519643 RepID=A0A1X7E6P9_9BACT|nr:hypothetical protein [Desulfovibrio gilichinskyi]SMF28561.1 hypothetical protein SAMN06295933_2722 [Desulfovibrio gilichinskyi]
MDDHLRLAALAVFRELFEEQKNLYDILQEFIVEIIFSQKLYSISSTTITAELAKNFGIRVPEAVVKSALISLSKKNDYCSKQGKDEFTIEHNPNGKASEINTRYTERQATNEAIFDRLITYINNKTKQPLSTLQEKDAISSFCAFLLNEKNGEKYSEYISSFILSNENDQQFLNELNEIREGVILYSGLTYNDKPLEAKRWKSSLTLFLDQEILFHCYGLNGELFKSYFEDFYSFVKEINSMGKGKFIKLRFFPETKDEVDSFFSYAMLVVRNKMPLRPDNSAMKAIVNGCQNTSDVIEKRTKFYHYLNTIGICIDDSFIFDKSKYSHNILSEEITNTIVEDFWKEPSIENPNEDDSRKNKFKEKINSSLTILNKIHCLRGESHSKNFYNVKYHFLTGTELTLKTAWHELVKGSESVPLANYLDWVTNKFWFKLNKGFEKNIFPTSSHVLAKARVVFSTIFNRNLGTQYDMLLEKHEKGELTKGLVQEIIFDLVEQTVNPEEVNAQSIDLNLELLQRDSLEYYRTEKEAERIRQEKQYEEKKRLLQEQRQDREKIEELTTALQNELTNKKITARDKDLANLENHKSKADKQCTICCYGLVFIIVSAFLTLCYGVHIYFQSINWNTLEPQLAEYKIYVELIALLITGLGITILSPVGLKDKIQSAIRQKIYTHHGVCLNKICELKKQKKLLMQSLK